MNIEKNDSISRSLFSGFVVGLLTIFSYFIAFEIGNWIMGPKYYIEIIIMMVAFSISTGAYYPLCAKGSAKSPIAMIAFFITMYAVSRNINIFEMNLFVIITIVTTTLIRILIWHAETKKEAPAPNNPSQK